MEILNFLSLNVFVINFGYKKDSDIRVFEVYSLSTNLAMNKE